MRYIAPVLCGLLAWSPLACSSSSDSRDGASTGAPYSPSMGMGPSMADSPDDGSATGESPSDSASTAGTGTSAPGSSASGGSGSEPLPDPSASEGGASAEGGAAGAAPDVPPPPPKPRIVPGVLTAGAWDDNKNFERFLGYRSGLAAQSLPGILPLLEPELRTAHNALGTSLAAHETLDISLVIDTTGSMGDEISYLQAEFAGISSTIAAQHPNAAQRWSLVTYRDVGDDYVVKSVDFQTDAEGFRAELAKQRAGGGGDFPEAPDQGLAALPQLNWRSGDANARLAFWVADAPHHNDKAAAMAEALRDVRDVGVHVYPVASSGVDELTELSMRTAAQLTGGRYLFLTNDSGIGNDHKEPTIPCYFVTSLRSAILRMVDIELSGKYHEPAATEVIRTGGDPQAGACKLGSGEQVFVY